MTRGRRISTGLFLLALSACRGDGDFAIVPGREPADTCALEGYFREDTRGLDDGHVDVAVSWSDEETREEGGRTATVPVHDRYFRVAGLPCAHPMNFAVSARAGGGRGGALHSTFGGVVAQLRGRSGDRLTNVRIDLATGMRFRGVVRDARTGAALAGARVSAMYQGYGRDGWTRPQEFAVSDANGNWRLHGVQRQRLRVNEPPALWLSRQGYVAREVLVTLPAGHAEATVDAALEPAPR
ncbi:MAG: carboxypeptidase-like regulatory domain-containing protein [Polyangiales bacterium]